VILAAGDGMATLVGAHVKTPRLPWNTRIDWRSRRVSVVAAPRWQQRSDNRDVARRRCIRLVVVLLLADRGAFVETVPIRLNDNISVPATAALVLWSCTFVDAGFYGFVGPGGLRVWAAIGLNVAVAALGYIARTVTVAGAIAGAIIGVALFVGTGLVGWMLLFASFLFAAGTTRLGLRRKLAAGIAEARGGRRGAGNAIANTGLAAFAALVALGMPEPSLARLAMVAALATAASDTVASEVGKAWGRTTWLVVGFRRGPPGTSGAVSLEGTAAGFAAAVLLAWIADGLISYEWILGVAVAATMASLVESVLGATLEESGTLNNDALNFVNAAIGAGLALVSWWRP
jgi:uncharacterized protein (TIGR00297 family)